MNPMPEPQSNFPENRERLTFRKWERLHHKSLVDGLFREGKSFYEFPFRLIWRTLNEDQLKKNFRNEIPSGIGPLQVMVTVPKKKRKKAVDRVLMRRRIREAYRLNRLPLRHLVAKYEEIRTLQISLIYIHDKNLPYSAIEEKFRFLVSKLIKVLEKTQSSGK